MKGDFSRDTFNSSRHFTSVLMQQGRVQLDADWNEQSAILLHYLRALAADLIGPFGGPKDNYGFGIFFTVIKEDPKKTSPVGELQLRSEEIDRLNTAKILEKGLLPEGDFLISRGHYYVDGLLCENEDYVRYTGQSDLSTTKPLDLEKGSYLIYLDVWERHITFLDDESIREVALGGPDTTTRTKIICQVKARPFKDDDGHPEGKSPVIDVLRDWEGWRTWLQPENRGRLKARVKEPDGADSSNPCLTAPDARYRGAENQLYRVEIHQGGKEGPATFKWSRENGSVVFPIVQIGSETITLAHFGRDNRQGLKVSDWVEVINDEMILSGAVSPLVQVESLEPDDFMVGFKVPVKGAKPPVSTGKDEPPLILRRWDHKGDIKNDGALKVTESVTEWFTLEDGVQIQFQDGGEYRAGDYWLIPARTATADVDWPKDLDGNPEPQSPRGVKHHFAPLAVVPITAKGKLGTIIDLRREITALFV